MRLLASLLLLCALAAPAVADGVYITESFGGADVKDELGERIDNAGRVRLALGLRRGSWAAELWGGAYFGAGHAAPAKPGPPACEDCPPRPVVHEHTNTTLGAYGLDLKYLRPVSRHLEIYLRGSASAMVGTIEGDDYGGRGLGVGAGAQLKGKVPALGFLFWPLFFTGVGPKVTAALYVDTGYDFYRLHPEDRFGSGPTIDARLTSLSFGFAVGSDF